MLERLKDYQVGHMLTAAIAVAALGLVVPSHADSDAAVRSAATAHVFVPTTVDIPVRDEEPSPTF